MVFAGRLDKLKGVELLLQAWRIVDKPEMQLVVCGTGEMQAWCERYISQYHLDNVVIKGHVSNREVKHYLAESQALVLPTQCYEGFPMTLMEAFSVGTPVIGSALGNTGEIIEEGVTGLHFDYGDASNLAEVIGRIDKYDWSTVNMAYQQRYAQAQNYHTLARIYHNASISKAREGRKQSN